MSIEKKLDAFKKVEKAAVPPFLYTRIEEAVKQAVQPVAPAWRWAAAAAFALLVFINVFVVINKVAAPHQNEMGSMLSAMHMTSTNNLYHE